MPRITKKVQALRDIEHSAQIIAGLLAFSRSNDKASIWRSLRTLLNIHTIIDSNRYLSRGDAGRHGTDILDNIIHGFSDDRFLVMFRMHRPSFWQLVKILEEAGGAGYWDGREAAYNAGRRPGGRPPRPVYQQVAVTLYMLGKAGSGAECSGVNLNIARGSITLYLWRTIKVLIKLLPDYVCASSIER